jgi:hypothetical protein
MQTTIENQIKKALELLKLPPSSTREDILLRTEELNKRCFEGRFNEDTGELSEYTLAMQTLLQHYRTDYDFSGKPRKSVDYMHIVSSYDERLDVAYKLMQIRIRKRKIRKMLLRVGIIIVLLSAIITSIAIPIARNIAIEHKYEKIEEYMTTFSRENMFVIGEYLDELPKGYNNSLSISTMYTLIMKHVTTIEEGNMYVDYAEMQKAYNTLEVMSAGSYEWDLTNYLGSVDLRIRMFNITWTDGEVLFSLRVNDAQNGERLLSTVPNNKEPAKVYYFFQRYDWQEFGYERVQDWRDRFIAYRIVSLSSTELTLYCYANGEMYVLHPTDE